MNCGPRSRFVIAADGAPLIVHNCENIVQAIARDVMMEGMYNAEASGYPVIGTVHDEVITVVAKGRGDIKALELLVCKVPAWADGMPLAAKGFVCDRYKKD